MIYRYDRKIEINHHRRKHMFIKKQVVVLVIVALVAAAFTGCQAAETKSGAVAASYNQGALNETELSEQLIKTAGMQSLLDLVDGGILAEVEPVTEEMTLSVEERIASIKSQYQDTFEVTLQMNGFDGEDDLRKGLLLDAQRQAFITHYVASTQLTEDAIKAYYDAFEPEVQASHILIQASDESEAAQATAMKEAQDLIKRINEGEDFAALAQEFSKDPGSGANGGDLGSFGKGSMVPEFEEAVFALSVGEVTAEPVVTQFGYHIIKKTGEGEKLAYEEMKAEIETILATQLLSTDQNLASKALVQLRKDNGLEISNPVLANQYQLFSEQVSQ
jgi:foldase protein PrsA